MVPQRHLVAAQLLRGGVQGTPAQLGAEGTGVLFLPVFKHHRADLGAADVVGHAVPGKQGLQGGVVHGLVVELRVQRYRHHLIVKADVLPQQGQTHRQGHTVLAAGHAHHHPVARGQHLVILHGFAHQAAEPLHGTLLAHDRLTLSTRLTMSLMEASLVRAET